MPAGDPTIEGLLRECTLRVDVGGQASGTGFYAAQGTVVTCAHVVEAARLSSDPDNPAIVLVDLHGTPHPARIETIEPHEDVDLAVLRLTEPAEHPCVLLDADFRERDDVFSFGFPEKYPEGTPAATTIEGELGAPKRWLQLKDGLVVNGLSGAGVVNIRTGGVCGVLKRTRNPKADLGGYAVPIPTLFRIAPRVETENQRAHAKESRWIDLLPAPVRRLRRASQRARPAETAPETIFVINVGQTEQGWTVTADIHPGGEEVGPERIDLNTVRQQVARLFRDWVSRGRLQQEGEITLLGGILYRALFPGKIGDRFAALRADGRRVAVVLRFEDGTDCDLIQLPWEHLYSEGVGGARGVTLAREANVTFSRSLERKPAPARIPQRRSLRVLVVAVRPGWVGEEQALAQVDEIVKGLETIAANIGAVDVVTMEEGAPEVSAIGDEIEAGDYHVVHYVGFGRFAGNADLLALGGEGEFGIQYAELAELAAELERGSPELLVLQLLNGRANELPPDFSVLAQRLMELSAGLPAVVASQYPTEAQWVKKFNETLYGHLARGTSVDVAVQEARSKVGHGRVSVSPALILRAPGDLRLAAPGRDVVSRQPIGAFAGYG